MSDGEDEDARSEFSFELERQSSVKFYKAPVPAPAPEPPRYIEFSDSEYEYDEDLLYEEYYDGEENEGEQVAEKAPEPVASAKVPQRPQRPQRSKTTRERPVERPMQVARSKSLVVHKGNRVVTYFGTPREALDAILEDCGD